MAGGRRRSAVTKNGVLRYTHRRKRGAMPSTNERGNYMRKILLASFTAALISTSLLYASAKIRSTDSGDSAGPNEASAQKSGPQLPPEEIINRFTKKESELREIWKE